MYIREYNDQAEATPVLYRPPIPISQTRISSSSPLTPACRGEHAGTRPYKTEDRYICWKFYSNIAN